MKILAISVLFLFSCVEKGTHDSNGTAAEYRVVIVENSGEVVKAGPVSEIAYIYKQNGKRERIALDKECDKQEVEIFWCRFPTEQKGCRKDRLLIGFDDPGEWPSDLHFGIWKAYFYQKYQIRSLDLLQLRYQKGEKVVVGYLEDIAGNPIFEKGIKIAPLMPSMMKNERNP
ncbi:MAG: hypothetical protein WC459_03925 [Patescibacteria group bacterium]